MHDKPVSLMLAAITWWSTRAACGHSLLVFRKPCPGDRAASAGSERSRISVIEVRPRPVVAQKKLSQSDFAAFVMETDVSTTNFLKCS